VLFDPRSLIENVFRLLFIPPDQFSMLEKFFRRKNALNGNEVFH
jgi:hypothetical protein